MTNDPSYAIQKFPVCAKFLPDRQRFRNFCNFLLQFAGVGSFHRANYCWSSGRRPRTPSRADGFAQKKVSGTLQPNKCWSFERLKVPDTFFWAKSCRRVENQELTVRRAR